MQKLMINNGVTSCPSHGANLTRPRGKCDLVLYLTAQSLTAHVKPARTAPCQDDSVLYLTPVRRYHDSQRLYRGFRPDLVLYLSGFCGPSLFLIVGMPPAPLFRVAGSPPKIPGICLNPFPLTFPLSPCPALLAGATLLFILHPVVGNKKTATVLATRLRFSLISHACSPEKRNPGKRAKMNPKTWPNSVRNSGKKRDKSGGSKKRWALDQEKNRSGGSVGRR